MAEQEEVIYNRFEQVLGEYIALHDEELHFKMHDNPNYHCIKLCGTTLRIRANDSWSKLPKHLKEASVAHEIAHRELGHASLPMTNPFYRLGCVMNGTVDPKELDADRFACKLIPANKYADALKELSQLAIDAGRSQSSILELQYREKIVRERIKD